MAFQPLFIRGWKQLSAYLPFHKATGSMVLCFKYGFIFILGVTYGLHTN